MSLPSAQVNVESLCFRRREQCAYGGCVSTGLAPISCVSWDAHNGVRSSMATPIVGWKELQFGQVQLCYRREGVQRRSWLLVLRYRVCQDRTFLRLVIGKDRDLVTTCFEVNHSRCRWSVKPSRFASSSSNWRCWIVGVVEVSAQLLGLFGRCFGCCWDFSPDKVPKCVYSSSFRIP